MFYAGAQEQKHSRRVWQIPLGVPATSPRRAAGRHVYAQQSHHCNPC
jgi:hypothetical protein